MTQINGYLIVPVPEGAKNISVANGDDLFLLVFSDKDGQGWNDKLPPGPWSIVEIDERVAGEIVDVFECIVDGELEDRSFLDYAVTGSFFPTALESYSSLLRSKGYEKAILLKKK
jgi:hypothetical protein